MKPNPDYIRNLLIAFQDADEAAIDIEYLKQHGFSYETKEFYFHMRLLHDQRFVVRDDGEHDLGVDAMLDGTYSWSVLPLRLTASGHEFASAMSNHTAFAAVKKSAASTSLSIMRDIAVAVIRGEIARHGGHLG